jgi:hypothetical protein
MKLTEDEIEKKLEAVISLQRDWRWKHVVEVILYYQGLTSQELFGKKFAAMDPVTKDKEHAAIVRSLNALNFVLNMPEWLGKRSWRHWDQVEKSIGKEVKNGRRK